VRDTRRNVLKDTENIERQRPKRVSTMPRAAVRFDRASFEAERYMVNVDR
jgi:hypothetical protein